METCTRRIAGEGFAQRKTFALAFGLAALALFLIAMWCPQSAQAKTINVGINQSILYGFDYSHHAFKVSGVRDDILNPDSIHDGFKGFGKAKVKVYYRKHSFTYDDWYNAYQTALDGYDIYQEDEDREYDTFEEYVINETDDYNLDLWLYQFESGTFNWIKPGMKYIKTVTYRCAKLSLVGGNVFRGNNYASSTLLGNISGTTISKSFMKYGKFKKGKGYKVLNKGKKIRFTRTGKVVVKYRYRGFTGKISFNPVRSYHVLEKKVIKKLKRYLYVPESFILKHVRYKGRFVYITYSAQNVYGTQITSRIKGYFAQGGGVDYVELYP